MVAEQRGRAHRIERAEAVLALVGALALAAGAIMSVRPGLRSRAGNALLASAGPPGAEWVLVERVVDGDTLVVTGGRTVRILAIDTPETVNPGLAGPQPMGARAAERLAELVDGKRVALERDVTDTDHYGRLLRHVWRGRSLVAEQLAREGLGFASSVPPDTRHVDRVRAAEDAARADGRGLWGLPRPTPLPVFGAPGR